MNDLTGAEEQYGFVFGNDGSDSASTPETHALVCNTPGCGNLNRLVQIHADTVLPVLCGGCGSVLHCDHVWVHVKQKSGTLRAPVNLTHDYCEMCGTRANETSTKLPPIDIQDLPLDIVAALIHQPNE